jgi:hypothetical protein
MQLEEQVVSNRRSPPPPAASTPTSPLPRPTMRRMLPARPSPSPASPARATWCPTAGGGACRCEPCGCRRSVCAICSSPAALPAVPQLPRAARRGGVLQVPQRQQHGHLLDGPQAGRRHLVGVVGGNANGGESVCSFPATAPKHYCCAACRNESNFRWEDNSTAPASVVSSFQDYAGPGYAHWAKYLANSAVTAEPQNWDSDNEFCVVAAQPAEFGYPAYYYFNGGSKADRVGWQTLLRDGSPCAVASAGGPPLDRRTPSRTRTTHPPPSDPASCRSRCRPTTSRREPVTMCMAGWTPAVRARHGRSASSKVGIDWVAAVGAGTQKVLVTATATGRLIAFCPLGVFKHATCTRAVTGTCSAPAPPAPQPCPALQSLVPGTRGQLVYPDNCRIYSYITTGGLNYTQAGDACSALTIPGIPGRGYLVSFNT